MARNWLIQLHLSWRNDYLTRDLFAEHHGLTVDEANLLLKLAEQVNSHPHPEE